MICHLFWFWNHKWQKIYNFDDDASIYPISYAFVVAFHPSLNVDSLWCEVLITCSNNWIVSVIVWMKCSSILIPQPYNSWETAHKQFLLSKIFSCKLKFVADLLKKWLAKKYFRRYKELDFLSKQKFKMKNPVDWEKSNCVICNFWLSMAASNFPCEKITT